MSSTIKPFLGIQIDYSRDSLLTDFALELLKEKYLAPSETSPQEAFARASVCYCSGNLALAQRMYDYSSKLWLMFSTPVLSNASSPYFDNNGLPISCFLSYVEDTVPGLINHSSEIKWLSVKGGGTAGHWRDLRSVSRKSVGPIPYLAEMGKTMLAYQQGTTRRGSYAAYLDVSHPDIEEFIELRNMKGGDVNRKTLDVHNAVNITDAFLEAVEKDLDWDLIDPADKTVRKTVKARYLWELILTTRSKTGEPYITQLDEANRRLPESLKERGLKINGSNLCNEILMPTDATRTAVCCLTSLNLEYFDQWKDTTIVEDLTEFLDNVLGVYVDKALKGCTESIYRELIQRSINSVTGERSIGIGTMGFHSYLQSLLIPFESISAKILNKKIFNLIRNKAQLRSEELAEIKGPYKDWSTGAKRRNALLVAVAPNANNSIIAGASPSIEPWSGNFFKQKTRIGTKFVFNKYLLAILEKLGLNTEEIISDIKANMGSVQGIKELPEEYKEVFKTAYEIDQRWIIDLARDRQEFICQGQSVNLFFFSGVSREYINKVHLRAFSTSEELSGVPLKGLYYFRTEAAKYITKFELEPKEIGGIEECLSCQG